MRNITRVLVAVTFVASAWLLVGRAVGGEPGGALEGTWVFKSGDTADGPKEAEEALLGQRLILASGKFRAIFKGKVISSGTYTFNATKTPQRN